MIIAALPDRIEVDDLARFPILTHASDTRPYAEVVDDFKRNSRSHSRPVSSSNLAAYLDMTLDGLGIATLPSPLVERFLPSGELVALDCDCSPTPIHGVLSADAGASDGRSGGRAHRRDRRIDGERGPTAAA